MPGEQMKTEKQRALERPAARLAEALAELQAAAAQDDPAGIARWLLACARSGEDLWQISPLDLLRGGDLEQAWLRADRGDDELRVLWRLLLAWELKATDQRSAAQATLSPLRHPGLPRFRTWRGEIAAYLLAQLSDLDGDLLGYLQGALLDEGAQSSFIWCLARFSGFHRALEVARAVPRDERRDQALAEISIAQSLSGLFSDAVATVQEISALRRRAVALTKVALLQRRAGELDGARTLLKSAVESVRGLKRRRNEALRDIALAQVEVGDLAGAAQTVREIGHKAWRSEAQAAVAIAQAQGGAWGPAMETVERITDGNCRVRALGEIAMARFAAHDRSGARATLAAAAAEAQSLELPWRKLALRELAIAQARSGEPALALSSVGILHEMALEVSDEGCRAGELRVLGQTLAEAGMRDAAREALAAATTAARQGVEAHEIAKVLTEIAVAQARIGDAPAARATAHAIQDRRQSSRTLAAVVTALLETGALTDALETAQEIEDGASRVRALSALTAAQWRAGDEAAAGATGTTLFEAVRRLEDQWRRDQALWQILPFHTDANGSVDPPGRDSVAMILQAMQQADEAQKRDDAVASLAAAQVRWGDLPGARSTLGQITMASPLDEALCGIVQAQAEAGQFSAALETARRIHWEWRRIDALALIAAAQMKAGASDPAASALGLLLETVAVLDDFESRAMALINVLPVFAEARLFDAAWEIVDRIQEPWRQAKAIAGLAAAQAQAGERAAARCSFAAAVERARDLEVDWLSADALLEIACAQIEVGELEIARGTLASAGDRAVVSDCAGDQSYHFLRIATALAEAGDGTAAREMAARIVDPSGRSEALGSLAAAAARGGDAEVARSALADAVALLSSGEEPEGALREIALAQAALGELVPAVETAGRIRSEAYHDAPLAAVAVAQARIGNLTAAVKTVRSLQDAANQPDAMEAVVFALSAAGERETARRLLAEAAEAVKKAADYWRSEGLKIVAVLQARAGWGSDAVQTASAIGEERGERWPEIATALIEAGDRESFKHLLLLAADHPATAMTLCALLPQLYSEQTSAIAAAVRQASRG